jgi:hypothetical protein
MTARFGSKLIIEGGAFPADCWTVGLEDICALATTPEVIACEFRDDIDEVLKLLSRDSAIPRLWHDLDHLVGLLTGIACMGYPRFVGEVSATSDSDPVCPQGVVATPSLIGGH